MDPARRVVRRVEAGAGEPPVVLEAGMNCGAASWQQVMPLLAPHVRVVAYDRAGLGHLACRDFDVCLEFARDGFTGPFSCSNSAGGWEPGPGDALGDRVIQNG
jgi:pimeloyl-ACP methyl ester carboxylesterase